MKIMKLLVLTFYTLKKRKDFFVHIPQIAKQILYKYNRLIHFRSEMYPRKIRPSVLAIPMTERR